MHDYSNSNTIRNIWDRKCEYAALRVTALWALSESALGGVLHAFKIPLTGLIIGGAAIVFISLIARFSNDRYSILKSTFIVILVKLAVSPHTPITAYLAVFIQGIVGQILFYRRDFFSIKLFTLAIATQLYSASQKMIVLTITFGLDFWRILNEYSNYLLKIFNFNINAEYNISLMIISAYYFAHFSGAIFFAVVAMKIPRWSDHVLIDKKLNISEEEIRISDIQPKRKKKSIFRKIFLNVFYLALFAMAVSTYFIPDFGARQLEKIILILARSTAVLILWYSILSPLALNIFKKFALKKKNDRTKNMEEIINLFPSIKEIVILSWQTSAKVKGFSKIKIFVGALFLLLLTADMNK